VVPLHVLCLKDEGIAFHDLDNISDFVLNSKHKTIVNDTNAQVSPNAFCLGKDSPECSSPIMSSSHTHSPPPSMSKKSLHTLTYNTSYGPDFTPLTAGPSLGSRLTTHKHHHPAGTTQINAHFRNTPTHPHTGLPNCPTITCTHLQNDKVASAMLYRTEFYDLFIRPLEFLVGRGMPMHRLLLEAAYDFSERCNLFKLMLEFSGHNIDMPIPCDVHWFFAEITKISHLHASDLLPTTTHNKAPLLRLDALPKSPEQSNPAFTKPVPTFKSPTFLRVISFTSSGLIRFCLYHCTYSTNFPHMVVNG
jgi:hypothetical protein